MPPVAAVPAFDIQPTTPAVARRQPIDAMLAKAEQPLPEERVEGPSLQDIHALAKVGAATVAYVPEDKPPQVANGETQVYVSGGSASGNTDFTLANGATELKPLTDYTVVKSIGKGGMGEVFLALKKDGVTKVAIKTLILDDGAIPDRRQLSRFKREVTALLNLHHPNIVEIYGFGELNGKPALVME